MGAAKSILGAIPIVGSVFSAVSGRKEQKRARRQQEEQTRAQQAQIKVQEQKIAKREEGQRIQESKRRRGLLAGRRGLSQTFTGPRTGVEEKDTNRTLLG